ncbi:putative Mg2+ transport P-type ATPase C MgtC [Mycolicibacterium madagascariense]|uniref:Putative Mg2+ transport P-type ATPase C MgtC n=1 Tax=Mycolicibacterium madagascariense TaxID=212765 RepID=A0A7I7XNN2_9MYCO|nr:MgtC/SapB family protein [Mycolicibacterium madagascariense]MCV7012729.1 MgtC/SapB family protein [Mycolicibacterium madagascariense]BBZ30804.1 putative Mg2+ transport P-type ATPase C MgtC [Mycolicibacterium madagascariense]
MTSSAPALDLLVRVGLALLLGVLIGVERQWRARMAGLQTMALVSMGAALFLILGAYSFHGDGDPTRVAAQIVSGIGFLGAGVIMKQGSSVTGLNTAATLWAAAAVGALAGAWMWREAVTGAIVIVTANGLLFPLASRMDRARLWGGRETHAADYLVELRCADDAEARVRAAITGVVKTAGLQLNSLRSETTNGLGEVVVRAELSAVTRDDAALEDAFQPVNAEPGVTSFLWSAEAPRSGR